MVVNLHNLNGIKLRLAVKSMDNFLFLLINFAV
jgi:sRNA-binding regulator protein Hfq